MRRGFTLAELLVVIGITLIVSAVSIPLYSYFQGFQTLESARENVLAQVQQARLRAVAGLSQSNHGLYFDNDSYTLYQGDSYASRDQGEDESYQLPDNIVFSGLNEINFIQKTGVPSSEGILVLTNTVNNEIREINIRSNGLIY